MYSNSVLRLSPDINFDRNSETNIKTNELPNESFTKSNCSLSQIADILGTTDSVTLDIKAKNLPLNVIELLVKSDEVFTPRIICQLLQGLCRRFKNSEDFNNAIFLLLSKLSESIDEFSAQDLSIAFSGLRNVQTKIPEVHKILLALTSKLKSCSDDIDYKVLEKIFIGIENKNCDDDIIYELLQILTSKIQSSTSPLISRALSTISCSLSRMNGSRERKYPAYQVLLSKVELCTEPFNVLDSVQLLFGLNDFHTNSPEELLNNYLKVVVPVVQSCEEQFQPYHASSVLYSIRKLNSDNLYLRQLLKVLIPKVESSIIPWGKSNVCTALLGLKSMNSDYEEVRQLLQVLLPKIESYSKTIGGDINKILLSLQKMNSSHTEVRQLFKYVAIKIEARERELFDAKDLLELLSSNSNFDSKYDEVALLLKALQAKVIKEVKDTKADKDATVANNLTATTNTTVAKVTTVIKKDTKSIETTKPIYQKKLTHQEKLDEYFQTKDVSSYSKTEVIRLIYNARTKMISQIPVKLASHYPKLLSFLETSKEVFSTKDVCSIIYGLSVDTAASETENEMLHQIISSVTNKLLSEEGEISVATVPLSAIDIDYSIVDISKAFTSLNPFTNDRVEIKRLLLLLSSKLLLKDFPEKMSPENVASCLYGLRRMTSNDEVVCHVLQVILSKIEEVDIANLNFSPLSIARSLNGLQHMNIQESEAVRKLIKILTSQLKSCTETFSATLVIMSLYAVRNMNTSIEMRELATELIPKILSCRAGFIYHFHAIDKLSGYLIKSNNKESAELWQLIRAIRGEVVKPKDPLPIVPHHISSKDNDNSIPTTALSNDNRIKRVYQKPTSAAENH